MTNAQAALLAATFHRQNMTDDVILEQAEKFKTWLDQADAAGKARIKVG